MRPSLALFALVCVGCATAPDDATPYDPPALYREIWDRAEACTGLKGNYSDLRFYITSGPIDDRLAGKTIGHDIYLDDGWQGNALVVKHEMIHALGVTGHPTVPFVDPCHATWDSYQGESY